MAGDAAEAENTSLAARPRAPVACSGDMNAACRPNCRSPVSPAASSARAMPKSITRGPSAASSTFDGLRSRCTSPARAWRSARPARPPAASTAGGGQRPLLVDRLQREGRPPACRQPRPVAVPGVHHPRGVGAADLRAAATSCRNRGRNSRSWASSGRTTLTATGLHGEQPRTPGPSRPSPAWPRAGTGRPGADPRPEWLHHRPVSSKMPGVPPSAPMCKTFAIVPYRARAGGRVMRTPGG